MPVRTKLVRRAWRPPVFFVSWYRLDRVRRRAGLVGRVAILAVGATLAGSISCRQVAGITDSPPTKLATAICGLPYGTDSCATCVEANCCTESNACAGSPACAESRMCVSSCNVGDSECRSRCSVDHPVAAGSSTEVSALDACLVSRCESECGLTCGAIADSVSPPANAATCEQCVETNACDIGTQCGASADCDAYLRCLLSCSTGDCHEGCGAKHPEGLSLLGDPSGLAGSHGAGTFSSAYAGVCAVPCAYGGNWSCVGHIVWPVPASTTTTIVLERVHDGSTMDAIEGATVSACPVGDTVCAAPLDTQPTDASGRVTLHVPTAQGTVNNPQGTVLSLRTTASGYVPAYAYIAAPLSEGTLTVAPADSPYLLTPSEFGAFPQIDVFAVVLDCLESTAPGVKVTTDNPALAAPTYYTSALSIRGTPGEQATDASGIALFGSVPEGPLVLTATPVAVGKPSGTVSVYVHAGAITEVALFPTP